MDGMRVLLIIVGFLVILAALGHGLWTIRKNSRVKKNNLANQNNSTVRSRPETNSSLGDSNFDEYGIGAVRTIKNGKPESKESPVKAAAKPLAAVQQPALFSDGEAPVVGRSKRGSERKEPSVGVEQLPIAFDEGSSKGEPNISSTEFAGTDQKSTPKIGPIDSPITTPENNIVVGSEDTTKETSVDVETDSNVYDDDNINTQADENPAQLTKHEPVVITLFVSGDIQGAILLQTVTELGFKFGDMDIFHRHADTTGKGPSLFSLANMYNPGVFDLDEIETFTTRGVALFMELPVPSDGHKTFTMMYNAANKIAEAMPRAAVLDGNRNPITKQSVQHTYQKIREFERRQHVANAARH